MSDSVDLTWRIVANSDHARAVFPDYPLYYDTPRLLLEVRGMEEEKIYTFDPQTALNSLRPIADFLTLTLREVTK